MTGPASDAYKQKAESLTHANNLSGVAKQD
jgi:hypothetical protein